MNSSAVRPRTEPGRKKQAKPKGLPLGLKTPNATTIAAMEAADRGEVEEASLVELVRLWEGVCAKSSRRRSSRKT
jgi:hypothetical protein